MKSRNALTCNYQDGDLEFFIDVIRDSTDGQF